MCRKSPACTINPFRLVDALGMHFSALVIDDDEMQASCFEKARKLFHPRISRGTFHPGDDVERHAGARGEFALTNVGYRARGPHVSTCVENAHEESVADWLALERSVSEIGTYRNRAVDRPQAFSCCCFALLHHCSRPALLHHCSRPALLQYRSRAKHRGKGLPTGRRFKAGC
jgi:hypothetical protein